MADSQAKTVVNELLPYAIHHLKSAANDSIQDVIAGFYCPEAIAEANAILWENYSDPLPPIEKRQSRGLKKAHMKEIDDIIKSMKASIQRFAMQSCRSRLWQST